MGRWQGIIKEAENIITPMSFLRDISRELSDDTDNLLSGMIERSTISTGKNISSIDFSIYSEDLEYTYSIFRLYYKVDLYPVLVSFEQDILKELKAKNGSLSETEWLTGSTFYVRGIACEDFRNFKALVEEGISTERVSGILKSLLAQIDDI